ncbi:threonine dehydratase [Inquilinus sp. CAU 1745]|uniref:threonine dehydratase n=1 Tax=Inquilinus sp. CAU 1745 TaxID=3140369 RepID=UPI00325B8DC2
MTLFSLDDLKAAAALVRPVVPETPAYEWPLLSKRTGAKVWVKHENHTPIGAFKLRGGLVYLDGLRRAGALPKGVVSATRGNHGQSIALAAARFGIPAVIVVPESNSTEKNAAMEGLGAELVVSGKDFDESRVTAGRIAEERDFHFVPSFHIDLVKGVATYAHELFTAVPDLAVAYVPIGMGSGICGMIAARDLLGLDTEIVGVVADEAPAYALSFEAGRPTSTDSARTFADGMACRDPHPDALAIIRRGAARILRLTEDEIAGAVRVYYADTHNLAEGAGAAALAGLIRERERYAGRRAAVILSGGNIDASVFTEILEGRTPKV